MKREKADKFTRPGGNARSFIKKSSTLPYATESWLLVLDRSKAEVLANTTQQKTLQVILRAKMYCRFRKLDLEDIQQSEYSQDSLEFRESLARLFL